MNNTAMELIDKAQADRLVAHDKLRWALDQAAREYERATGQAITRIETFRKGADWQVNLWTINAVRAVDEKVFV